MVTDLGSRTEQEQEGRRLNEAKIKDLTGGDMLVARHLYQEYFEFVPTHKLWLVGNHKPIIKGTDEGIWRRIMLIPFSVVIPESARRPMIEMLKEFKSELPGILNWTIEGYREYKRIGLQPPHEVTEASNDYRCEMDVLNTFLVECCAHASSASVANKALYTAYVEWCEENQEHPLANRQLVARLKERGLDGKRGSANVLTWRGIGLRSEVDPL
jgi:putative DNA primase/helicase